MSAQLEAGTGSTFLTVRLLARLFNIKNFSFHTVSSARCTHAATNQGNRFNGFSGRLALRDTDSASQNRIGGTGSQTQRASFSTRPHVTPTCLLISTVH